MKKLIIIGAGPGGYVAAIRGVQMGGKVLLIEKEEVGGTCLNRGCIPTKALIGSASTYNIIKRSVEFGIDVKDAHPILPKIMGRKERIVLTLRKGVEALIKKNQIELIKGEAKVVKENSVTVEKEGKEVAIEGDYIVIATGSSPRSLKGVEFDGKDILSSDHLLNLEEIPKSMVIVGGGVIGCEFAYILSSFGCRVHIIEAMDRLLPIPTIDGSCSGILEREMKKRGVKIIKNSLVSSVHRTDDNTLNVRYVNEKTGEEDVLSCEKIAVCVGRKPTELSIPPLGGGDIGWIDVDDTFKTRVDSIYAIGDCLGPKRPMLAHAASHEALCCISNIFGKKENMDYLSVPSVVYTEPEIGCVGLSEEMARDRGVDFDVSKVMFRSLGRSHTCGDITGEAKILFDKKTKKILGIHIIGPHASELIATGCVLLKKQASVVDLEKTVFAHPTFSEIFHEIGLKSLSRSIHG